MKKGMIQVTDTFERIVHWILAISCIVLFITGLGMMFQSLNFIGTMMGGLSSLKYVHNMTGLVFAPSLVFAILMWWKEAGTFDMPVDWEWFKTAGGYLWHVEHVPETGKYNPGQKLFFLTVAAFGILMFISGIAMWFQFLPLSLTRLMYPLHALGFVILFVFFFVHVYLGTIGNPGSLQAMLHGWVTPAWAKKQHPKWYKEMKEQGKLKLYGEEHTSSAHGH